MTNIDWYNIILGTPVFILALSIHEYAHAKLADMMGDPTPRWAGRLTIDPRAHIDILGLIALYIARFGWAKPVPINPSNFRNYRRGTLLVGIAGPLANLLMAIATVLVLHIIKLVFPVYWEHALTGLLTSYPKAIFDFLNILLITNIGLFVFNLIPFPPLDGSRVLAGLIPESMARLVDYLESGVGPILLILLIYSGFLSKIISPVIEFVFHILVTGL